MKIGIDGGLMKSFLACCVMAMSCLVGCSVFGAGHGVLLMTFDDAENSSDWVKVLPLFEKHKAHVSFFPNGWLPADVLENLRKLKDAGHTIGMHTANHGHIGTAFQNDDGSDYISHEINPQLVGLAKIGHIPRALAYPFNEHTAESDAGLMSKCGIRRFRTGHVTRYDPQHQYPRADLLNTDEVFFPFSEIFDKVEFPGIGIGEDNRTDIDEIVACINRAADRNEVLVTSSHGITPDAKEYHMKTEWLERMLEAASARGMDIIGMDEIDDLKFGRTRPWFDAKIETYETWADDAELAEGGSWQGDRMSLESSAALDEGRGGLLLLKADGLRFGVEKPLDSGVVVIEFDIESDEYDAKSLPPVNPADKGGVITVCENGRLLYYGLARQGNVNVWSKLEGPDVPPDGKSAVRIALRTSATGLVANYRINGWTYSLQGSTDIGVCGDAGMSTASVAGEGWLCGLSGRCHVNTGIVLVVR